MKASELRIGNYVGIAEFMNFKVAKVTNVRNDRILAEINSYVFSSKNNKLIPIELNEEILLKCGFEKVFASDPQMEDACLAYSKQYLTLYKRESEVLFYSEQGTIVKHIHQLQNLYFTLTGEELTIKE